MFRVSIVVTTTLNGLLSCLSSTLEDPQFCPISNPKTIHFKHPFSNHISNSLKTLFETPQKLYFRPLKKNSSNFPHSRVDSNFENLNFPNTWDECKGETLFKLGYF
jgi:hypothetical protein